MNNRYKLGILGLALTVILALVGVVSMTGASADPEECVPADAYTETIEHPEVSHVVHHEAVTHEETVVDQEATPEVWANWSPNHNQGPFDGPPAFPTDSRGTWHIHNQIPGGHAGPDGVYQRDNPGNGNGDWFYRHNMTPEVTHTVVVVDEEAYDETVVDEEAWTEVIEHEAVVCDDEPPVDEPPVDEPPVVKPPKTDKPDKGVGTPTKIEKPGPGEEITFQSFDGDGNLVVQKVGKPIPEAADQEGM